ncbi:hypothetical protein BDP81DRAFT_463935 [Colletotrichum phormii]|uniref:Zn(2)-C6 fungal-type domain-containing protein n=1 Tax=Colletotrichum phormii TaxID=359342 RepID=A0AAI9ZJK1_9PEZI|nr:uncharacterized protein BDP81DRAFT_463935 [Colletotrichum phormii]KAK1625408.1 hypothetical protein BDP81DRAFT_463935 [Colletotrichum phormii]
MSPASRANRESDRRKLRRTKNACISCRQGKIKCSGEEPCANCQRRLMKCEYMDGTNPTVDSERRNLGGQRHGAEHQSTPGSKRSRGAAFGSDDEDSSKYTEALFPCCIFELIQGIQILSRLATGHLKRKTLLSVYTSPFTLPSTTIKNTHRNKRNWIWLAPSSTWSFTARLTLMVAERLQVETPFSFLPSIMPSNLFNTVKFHLSQNYQLIDETNFVKNIEEFYYSLASKKAAESHLWFVQFLLVLSFGQAFLSRSKGSREPPGAKFFVRAMALLPETNSLWKDSLLAIERESAQLYIAQAIRIAQLEGLHTQLAEDALGTQAVARCRSLWWTFPMNTQDADITTVLDPPSICSQRDATLGLQVKLSRLLSSIITTIYRSEKTPLGEFLTSTKSILHTLAGHAQEIERITRFKFQNSVDTMPKGTRSITLLYHQCVIMATRPLFLSALKQELENFGWDGRDPQTFSSPLKTLVSTGIKSAAKTLQILSGDDSLLEVFLTFELEYAYRAAIHFTMANALFPAAVGADEPAQMRQTHNDMASKGNLVAEVRKAELAHLETLFREFTRRVGEQDFEGRGPSGLIEAIADPTQTQTLINEPDLVSTTTLNNTEFLETIGISSDDFLSIVEQMGNEDDLPFSITTGFRKILEVIEGKQEAGASRSAGRYHNGSNSIELHSRPHCIIHY